MPAISRRLFCRAALILGLAVLSTLAAAWGSALLSQLDMFPAQIATLQLKSHNGEDFLDVVRFRSWTRVSFSSVQRWGGLTDAGPDHPRPDLHGFVEEWAYRQVTEQDVALFHLVPKNSSPIVEGHGFPFPALWSKFYDNGMGAVYVCSGIHGPKTFRGLFSPKQLFPCEVVLPYRPIWRGALGDVVVFAAFWSVVLWSGSALRRLIRSKPGHCPRCNYDLSGLAAGTKCPECGR